MENFVKFLPLIIVALLLFVAKEGYSIFKYAKQGRLHEAARSGRLDLYVHTQNGRWNMEVYLS